MRRSLFAAASWLETLSCPLHSSILRSEKPACFSADSGAALLLPFLAGGSLSIQLVFAAAVLLAFGIAVWKYAFDAKERNLFLNTSLQIRAAMGESEVTLSRDEVTIQQDKYVSEPTGVAVPHQAFLTRVRAATNTNFRRLGKVSKHLVRGCLEPVGSVIYLCRGRLPLTLGYRQYRNQYLRKVLGNDELLNLFNTGRELPGGFGARLDERFVEYPWMLSRLARYKYNLRILDAGSTFNYEEIRAASYNEEA